MSTPKITRAVQNLLKQISHMARTLTKGMISWLLRGLLMMGRRPIASAAGFVLPTTVLLLLVVTLTVGAIGFRTYTRSQQAIGERQQRVIYNAATPAIDRAKAKLEFIFNSNRDRRSSAVPDDKDLLSMMLNDGIELPYFSVNNPSFNPYQFPGETPIDINNDGKKDNAWMYETEPDASGRKNRIVYSIVFGKPPTLRALRDSTKAALQARADKLLVRNAPLSNNTLTDPACVRNTGEEDQDSLLAEGDWFEDQADSSMLRKNFQVDAYVLSLGADNEPDPNSTVATLEFQQDREATQGFRWAAWFRNDLEIFPGPPFNWNGAMHTEGNYFLTSENNKLTAFMVSDPDSCLYKENASSITTPQVEANANANQPFFQGQFIAGELRGNSFSGSTRIDVWNGEKVAPLTPSAVPYFDTSKDSVKNTSGVKPEDFALDPIRLHTQDVSASRNITDFDNYRDDAWKADDNQEVASPFGKRLKNQTVKKPYLDDTFRADNRYGPKPTLDASGKPLAVNIGSPIDLTNEKLTNEKEGLDGYWERRARTDGLRIIVGQRLELGDPAGWGGPTDGNPTNDVTSPLTNDVAALINEPLRPWLGQSTGGCTGGRCNEARQRRSLWDNLAAVQATAIYHKASGNPDYPAACMATTVHPGTAGTLDKSATFENLAFGFESAVNDTKYNQPGRVISDFFRGRGTNGWQYSMPAVGELSNYRSNSALGKALKNLAYFAGDPNGGAPSFEPVQGSTSEAPIPHPFPSMAMWGDFSMLRLILDDPDSTPYANLSFADQTTLHTAACMLGMLAYNIDYLNKFKPDYLNNVDPPSNFIPEEIIGKADITPLAADVNDPYWKGLRGHIRAIDALIYDGSVLEATDGVAAGVPDRLRIDSDTKIPLEIKKLTPQAMEVMDWIEEGGGGSKGNNDPETYVRLLEFWRDAAIDGNLKERLTKEIALARLIITKEQVSRDRKFGFLGSYANRESFLSDQCQTWYKKALDSAKDGEYYKEYAKVEPLMRLCSDRPRYPILFSLFPLFEHGDVGDDKRVSEIISDPSDSWKGERVISMVRDKGDIEGGIGLDSILNYRYLNGGMTTTVNQTVTYQVLSNTEIGDIAAQPKRLGGLGFGGDWTLPTAQIGDGSTPNGAVVTASVTSGTTIEKRYDLIKICPPTGTWQAIACSRAENISLSASDVSKLKPVTGPRYRIPFKDSALMNGRELMSVRALNLDLDLMRLSPFGSDYWLPKSGIIYAFREDAVSEAHIVRPKSQVWNNCDTLNELLNTASGCQMDTAKRSALKSIDPPLNDRKISAKPVDFYPDPDRRPHGFRLRNGAALWRGSSSGSEITDDADPAGRGLSFITHNPAYVQGYFNLHRAADKGLKRLDGWEEFQEKLNTANFGDDAPPLYAFYGRTNLEDNFADRNKDQWRPAEVLGDAVTLLSPFFCDGSIEDGLITAAFTNSSTNEPDYGVKNNVLTTSFVSDRYGCANSSDRTSYLNQNRATKSVDEVNKVNSTDGSGVKWVRSSIVDTYWRAALPAASISNPLEPGKSPLGRSESPIYIARNGDPLRIKKTSPTAIPSIERYEDVLPPNNAANNYGYAVMRPGDKTKHLFEVPTGKDIQMNMILISGLVPSRAGQSYGGLHNFPRFLEAWNKNTVPLYFSGALLQLNFSTYATAPFDQEQWQPDLAAPTLGSGTNEWLAYYGAPDRRWGFDVGLKYAPPGPVAERFRSPEPTRSEFYDEPPADDPYICLLARVANPNNSTCPPI